VVEEIGDQMAGQGFADARRQVRMRLRQNRDDARQQVGADRRDDAEAEAA